MNQYQVEALDNISVLLPQIQGIVNLLCSLDADFAPDGNEQLSPVYSVLEEKLKEVNSEVELIYKNNVVLGGRSNEQQTLE